MSVITLASNRIAIDAWLCQNHLPNVRFYYVDVPRPFRTSFGTGWRRIAVGEYLYYTIWQYMAWRVAQNVLAADPFDVAHHVTYCSLPGPTFMQNLTVPFIFGPVGGGEVAPWAFWVGGGAKALFYECARYTRLKVLRWDPLVQSTLRKAARILVSTPDTERLVPTRCRGKTFVMPSVAVEHEALGIRSRDEGSGRRVFAAGRLVHWKGFHLAIRAFARIALRYPDATFTIIGDGPQRMRLERLIEAEGVGGRVRITGLVPQPEVLRLAAESNVLLLPSLHDAGGSVVLEAMAVGRPVICLDIGGPGRIVTPECGIKVPVTTPERVVVDLAGALERLLADPELQRRMGNAARQRVSHFLWDRKVEQFLAIYGEVVASGSSPKGRSAGSGSGRASKTYR